MSSTTPVAPPGIFPAPPGVVPNYEHPVQRLDGLLPLICIFLTLSTIVLIIRLYTKAFIIKVLGWEDVAISLGWASTVALMSIFLDSWRRATYGIHTWDMTMEKYGWFAKADEAAVVLYVFAVGLPKVSILLFYLKLNPSTYFRYGVFAVLSLTLGYIITFALVLIFPCHPVKKAWEPLTPGHCLPVNPVYLACPIINTTIDVFTLLLPIPMLINLQVNRRTKVLLGVLFAICSCTIVISATRIWSVSWILKDPDIIWQSGPSNSLTISETNLTVVCGSVMVLRPFCRRHLPFLLTGKATRPTDEQSPAAANGLANFDGPSGPRSKSGYLAKVSGGGYSGSKRSGGKRNLFGSTLVKEDGDDLESLSAELNVLAPHVKLDHHGEKRKKSMFRGDPNGFGTYERDGGSEKGERTDGSEMSEREVGVARSSGLPRENGEREEDLEKGIVKTVSLDVR